MLTTSRRAVPWGCVGQYREPAIPLDDPAALCPSSSASVFDICDVHFSYQNVAVLRGCSLRLQPGRVVAVVGPSGGGKTTLTKLLQRFYDPSAGLITLDGVPLTRLNVAWLRHRVRVVDQVRQLWRCWLPHHHAAPSLHHKHPLGCNLLETAFRCCAIVATIRRPLTPCPGIADARRHSREQHRAWTRRCKWRTRRRKVTAGPSRCCRCPGHAATPPSAD